MSGLFLLELFKFINEIHITECLQRGIYMTANIFLRIYASLEAKYVPVGIFFSNLMHFGGFLLTKTL